MRPAACGAVAAVASLPACMCFGLGRMKEPRCSSGDLRACCLYTCLQPFSTSLPPHRKEFTAHQMEEESTILPAVASALSEVGARHVRWAECGAARRL